MEGETDGRYIYGRMSVEQGSAEVELQELQASGVDRELSFSRGFSESTVPVVGSEEDSRGLGGRGDPDLVSHLAQDEDKQVELNFDRRDQSYRGRQSYTELRPQPGNQELKSPDLGEFSFHYRPNSNDNVELVSDEQFEAEFGIPDSAIGSIERSYHRVNSRKHENGFNTRPIQQPVLSAEEHDRNNLFEDSKTERVVGGWSGLSPLLKVILRTILFVLVWYTFSTSLTLYNKLLLGAEWGKFPAPLLMNTIHFSMQALVSTLMVRFCCPSLLPTASLSWKDYFLRVVPAAVATALDIDLSNASFVSITVTFATMCKSTAPVFLLLFAFAFKLETPSFKLLGIILMISVGVLLAVARETEFELVGFILIMLAAVMSGFRWVVTQVLLQKEEYGLSNPFAAMSCITPVMALVTGIASLIFEPWQKLSTTTYFDTPHHIFSSLLLMLLGGSLAFFMVVSEYLLISETSAVTFTVAGVVKEVVTIIVAVFFFHDHFTVLTGVGLIIIISGVSLFNWFKYQKLVEEKLDFDNAVGIQNEKNAFKYTILEEDGDREEAAF